MDSITLIGMISSDRRLVVELPDDLPTGRVELVIRSLDIPIENAAELTRDELCTRLQNAGILRSVNYGPLDVLPLSVDERLRIGQLPEGARPSEDLISEDRGHINDPNQHR